MKKTTFVWNLEVPIAIKLEEEGGFKALQVHWIISKYLCIFLSITNYWNVLNFFPASFNVLPIDNACVFYCFVPPAGEAGERVRGRERQELPLSQVLNHQNKVGFKNG